MILTAQDARELYYERKEQMGDSWDPWEFEIVHGSNVQIKQDDIPIEVPIVLDTRIGKDDITFGYRKIRGKVTRNRKLCSTCVYCQMSTECHRLIKKNGMAKASTSYCNYCGITGETALKRVGKHIVNLRGGNPEKCNLYQRKGKKEE